MSTQVLYVKHVWPFKGAVRRLAKAGAAYGT